MPVVLRKDGGDIVMKVALFQGELEYMSVQHLKYVFPAIFFVMVIILPPPLLLICEPLIMKFSGKFNIKIKSTSLLKMPMILKPFLDSFQGCFKDNFRFFAGLFFVYRFALLFLNIIAANIPDYYTYVITLLTFIITIHFMVQRFNTKWHNKLDLFLLINLQLVTMLTLINYYSDIVEHNKNKTTLIAAIQLILITLPLVYFGGYCVYHVGFEFKHCRVFWEKLYNNRKDLTSVANHEENIFDRLDREEEEQNAFSEI